MQHANDSLRVASAQSAPSRIGLILLSVLFAASAAHAKRIYQWKDAQGITHFTDSKPGDVDARDVKESLVRADAQRIVDLSSTDTGNERRLIFNNRLAGPVEVELAFQEASGVISDPSLPLRAVLPANRETPVATIRPDPAAAQGIYSLTYRAVPGDPAARPSFEFVYRLPFHAGTTFEVHQGFNGAASHNVDQSRYSVDLAVAEGTPVLAARAGLVMQVERDFYGAGTDREKFGDRANVVRILHEDGSMAVYAHLALEGVTVGPGQRVAAGQQIGYSGNTGFSSGPHLHFSVQVNTGMDLKSIPFSIEGVAIPQ
jgi:murein DD-endopeptidase MepM/ murein hydrolase activator NlpD